jgi:hypothetical protein
VAYNREYYDREPTVLVEFVIPGRTFVEEARLVPCAY